MILRQLWARRHVQDTGRLGPDKVTMMRGLPHGIYPGLCVGGMRQFRMGVTTKDAWKLQGGSGVLQPRGPRHRSGWSAEYLKRWWRLRALSSALGRALEDSRLASSWRGERLRVSFDIAEKVERATQRLQLETGRAAKGGMDAELAAGCRQPL